MNKPTFSFHREVPLSTIVKPGESLIDLGARMAGLTQEEIDKVNAYYANKDTEI